MNLSQVIQVIERVAAGQPTISTVVRNDVFRLNPVPDVRYGAFAWLQREHVSDADSNLITYNFTLFYVDRLRADGSNEVEVQSVGIETLDNILRALPDLGVFPGSYTFQAFNQRFADQCAGVFCNVQLETAKGSMCAAAFEFLEQKDGAWVEAEREIKYI